MILFARNEAANKFLAENPAILGGGALVFGLGALALVTGKAPTKRGPDLEGGHAKLMAAIWLLAGSGCLLFGLYKIASALL